MLFLQGWETETISLALISNCYGLTMSLTVSAAKVISDVWVLGGEACGGYSGQEGATHVDGLMLATDSLRLWSLILFFSACLCPSTTWYLCFVWMQQESLHQRLTFWFYMPQAPAFLFFIYYLVSGIQL